MKPSDHVIQYRKLELSDTEASNTSNNFKIQIYSRYGETKFLDITDEEFLKIKNVLLGTDV